MATYVNDLRLKEISTGDESGTWGTSTNTNLELIGEAFSFGTEAITTNADTHTTTIADGSTDPGRSIYLQYTGTLDSTCTITIGPNTVSKLWFIENATSGSQDIIIKQGSGATVTVPNGNVKAIYSDGAGSGGKMVDAFTALHVKGLVSEVDDNGAALTVISTDADASLGPLMVFRRESSSPADDDLLGRMNFNGFNDASEGVTYGRIQTTIRDASDGTEDGELTLSTIVAGSNRSRAKFGATETVFNEASVDIDFRIESDSNAYRFFLDAGNDRIVMGHTAGISTGGVSGAFQQIGDTSATRSTHFTNFSADANSSAIRFAKSRGSSIGSNTVVQSGDNLGIIVFSGDDGSDLASKSADILAEVDGTPASNDMPGRLVFRTTADGSDSVSEAMRINDEGDLLINTTTDYGGKVNIARADNNTTLALVCTDSDAADGPILDFIRDSSTPSTSDDIALINFKADDDAGNRDIYAQIEVFSQGITSGSEQGRITFSTNDGSAGLQNRIDLSGGETVFNNGSVDIDFRVESDDNTHCLFVNAATDKVGIKTSSPDGQLHIHTASAGTVTASGGGDELVLENSSTVGMSFLTANDQECNIVFGDPDNNDVGVIQYDHSDDSMKFTTGAAERMRVDANGNLLQGITTIPTGVQSSRQLISSSSTGAEIIAYRNDNAIAVDDFIGAFLIGHDDNSGTEDHFIGMWGEGASSNGNMNLKFAAGRDKYEAGTSDMMIASNGRVSIGTTSGSYTHDTGLRVVGGEVGSHVLDAAVSIEGSGGDFYPLNFTGPTDTGFGALAAFSPSTDYLVWQYRSGDTSTNIMFMLANGNVTVSGALSKGSGSFKIDHPLPAKTETHHLVHSFIEGPQADLIYRGKIDLVGGSATVNIDTAAGMTEGTFVLLNTNTQCFTSNESGWTAVKGSVSGNTLTITAQENTCTDTISWMVVGERKDQHMLDTDWTDENGKVIVEPLKESD